MKTLKPREVRAARRFLRALKAITASGNVWSDGHFAAQPSETIHVHHISTDAASVQALLATKA